MKKGTISFLLRMAIVGFILGAFCGIGAYASFTWCAEMLLTPACSLFAYAAYQTEKTFQYSAKRKNSTLRVVSKDPVPMRVA